MKFGFRKICLLCVLALSAFTLTACEIPFDLNKNDPVVVSVGERKLLESEVRKMAPQWDSWGDREKLSFLEHWIDEETIYQEAVVNNVLNDSLLQRQIEETTRKMVVDHFLQSFADTMMVGDAERLDYYTNHPELFLRGKTMVSGALIYFKDWQSADQYYKGHKNTVYDSMPNPHYLVKKIETFDSVTVTPDSCMIPSITEATLGKLSVMKVCGGALKMAVVISRLDSADVLPYAEVANDVADRAWVEHQKVVMSRLKKDWKKARPIFSQMNVFSEKEQ
ncbi:MAG: hypothetical protein MJY98_08810 [Fibrobacter sp.]|nr:hypothetical protein [Fibrobacter sp.]